MTEWFPLGMTSPAERAEFSALREGFPGATEELVQNWFYAVMTFRRGLSPQLRRGIADSVVVTFDLPATFLRYAPEAFCKEAAKRIGLDVVVDYYLAHHADESETDKLRNLLGKSRSSWGIGERHGHTALVPKIEPVVVDEALQASQAPDAGAHLARAWDALHGVNPDTGKAALEANLAVEAAYGPLFEPKNMKRTGSSIAGSSQMRV